MARNYNLNDDDYDTIYNHWDADAHEKTALEPALNEQTKVTKIN